MRTNKNWACPCYFGCDQVVFGRSSSSYCLKGPLHWWYCHDTTGTLSLHRPDRWIHISLVSKAYLVTWNIIVGKARVCWVISPKKWSWSDTTSCWVLQTKTQKEFWTWTRIYNNLCANMSDIWAWMQLPRNQESDAVSVEHDARKKLLYRWLHDRRTNGYGEYSSIMLAGHSRLWEIPTIGWTDW